MPTNHDDLFARIDASEAERDHWEHRAKRAERALTDAKAARYADVREWDARQEKTVRDDERMGIVEALRSEYPAAAEMIEKRLDRA